jgi:hypothetical protein
LDEQPKPSSSRAKRRVHLEVRAEGNRPKRRLDKYSRVGRRPKRYDDGGTVSGPSQDELTQEMADWAAQTKEEHPKTPTDFAAREAEYGAQTKSEHQDDEP